MDIKDAQKHQARYQGPGGTNSGGQGQGCEAVREAILNHDSAATSRVDQSTFHPRPKLLFCTMETGVHIYNVELLMEKGIRTTHRWAAWAWQRSCTTPTCWPCWAVVAALSSQRCQCWSEMMPRSGRTPKTRWFWSSPSPNQCGLCPCTIRR